MLCAKPTDSNLAVPPARRAARRRARLVVLGDLVLDVIIRPERPLIAGSDVPGTISFRAGGSAANVCRVFAGLGGSATFIGAVGDDAWGRRLTASLRRDGVRVRAPKAAAALTPTARLAALIEEDGERSFVTQRGAADMLDAKQLEPGWFKGIDFLHLPAYSLLAEPLAGAAHAAAGHARAGGSLVSVDLASRGPLLAQGSQGARERIGRVEPDLLLGNLDEALAICGRRNPRRLLELAPVVVIKEGSAGCRVLWRRAAAGNDDVLELDVATTPVETADTTGAGDAFDAGFLHSLAEQARAAEHARAADGHARAGDGQQVMRRAQALRRAAVAGHRAAARLLGRPRPELVL